MARKPKAAELDLRGHITVPLEGVEYVLRPDYEAIESIEEQLGRKLYELASDATQSRLSYLEMGVICAEMMKAHARAKPDDALYTTYRAANPKRLSQMIYDYGGPRVMARLTVLLVGALTGGYTASGELKAGTERTSPKAQIPAAS